MSKFIHLNLEAPFLGTRRVPTSLVSDERLHGVAVFLVGLNYEAVGLTGKKESVVSAVVCVCVFAYSRSQFGASKERPAPVLKILLYWHH